MIGELLRSAIKIDYEQKGTRNYIGISQIGYCQRKLYIQLTGKTPDIPVEALFRFLKGNAGHEIARKLLWKQRGKLKGFVYMKSEKEIIVDCGDNCLLKGHCDLKFKSDNKIKIGDLKIISPYIWNKLEDARQHEIDQVTMYGEGDNVDFLELCYVNDSTGQDKTFDFTCEKDRVEFLKEKTRNLFNCINKNKEPDPIYKSPEDSEWECGYCFNYKNCWGEKIFNKKDNIISISDKLNAEFIEWYLKKQDAENNLDIVKEKIINICNGSKGISQNITASLVIPKPKKEFNKKKFEKENPVIYNQYLEDKEARKPYYKINTRGI